MLTACCALFFAEARMICMAASPAALAWKVRTQTVPDSVHAGDAGRTRSRDHDIAHTIVAMNQRDGLAVMAEISRRYRR